MNTIQRLAATSTLVLGALSLAACSNMSTRDKYTAGGDANENELPDEPILG